MNSHHLHLGPSRAELKSDSNFSFLITTHAYEFPEIQTGFDADWLQSTLYMRTGAFQVELNEGFLRSSELIDFLQKLKAFSALKEKHIELLPLEQIFQLKFSFNARKNVMISGYVQYPLGLGPTLEFQEETNLSYVDSFIEGIELTLSRFPLRT